MNTHRDIECAFLAYYKELLGTAVPSRLHVNSNVVKQGKVLTRVQGEERVTPIAETEIKNALWGMYQWR